MRGKNKCKILREIRQRIAEENDIPLVTKECTYQGECSGTCPKCESELRYLEQQLARRQTLGKVVTVAALSVSLMAGAAGCGQTTAGVPEIPVITAPGTTGSETGNSDGPLKLLPDDGVCDTSTESIGDLAGRIDLTPETETVELEGDIAYIPIPDDTETAGAPTTAPVEGEQTSEPGMLEAVGGNG